MRILDCLPASAIAAALTCLAGPVIAQTPGVYAGTSADGQAVSFTVGYDVSNKLAIVSVSTSSAALCPDGTMFPFGSGYGQDAVIMDDEVGYTEEYAYLYQKVTGQFSGDNFNGHIISISPELTFPATGLPRQAQVCRAANQKFTATLQSSDAQARPVQQNPTFTYHR